MRHSKPAKKRKEDQIRVRVTGEQKERFTQAAERMGISLSSWLVQLGNAATAIATEKT
jgi:predicted HicB family RNase H-like nuclease